MAPIRHGSRVTRSSAFQVPLSRACARSAGEWSALIIALPVWLSTHGLGGDLDADPGAGVTLVGQRRQASSGGGIQRWQGMGAGGGDVVSRPGFEVADPDRISGGVGEHLDVPAVLLVLAGVPEGTGLGGCAGVCGGNMSVPSRHTNAHPSPRPRAKTSDRSGACRAITSIASCTYRYAVATLTLASRASSPGR
jgi:hypothetical protein